MYSMCCTPLGIRTGCCSDQVVDRLSIHKLHERSRSSLAFAGAAFPRVHVQKNTCARSPNAPHHTQPTKPRATQRNRTHRRFAFAAAPLPLPRHPTPLRSTPAGCEKGRASDPHGERSHHPLVQACRLVAGPRLPGRGRRARAKLPQRRVRCKSDRGAYTLQAWLGFLCLPSQRRLVCCCAYACTAVYTCASVLSRSHDLAASSERCLVVSPPYPTEAWSVRCRLRKRESGAQAYVYSVCT